MIHSAYVHIPFCRHRCGYCNFTLVAGRDELANAFLHALTLEIDYKLAELQLATPLPLDTLFMGGGTPSHLSSQQLDRLLRILCDRFTLAPKAEFSCEANPLDCTDEKLVLLRAAGVNRLSIGGQSFDDQKLRRLERDHTHRELREAIERARLQFPSVSLDLIFAAPEESLVGWRSDLAQAIATQVEHVSTYGLTIERGSAFYGLMQHGSLLELDADLQLDMYHAAIDDLTSAGFEHYEVSNFAKAGHSCRHNEAYWLGEPWLAFGPGAASFTRSVRAVNHRSTTTYIRRLLAGQSAVAESESLNLEQVVRERLVFGLRRMAGVDLSDLSEVWGSDVESLFQPALQAYVERGWLARTGSHVALTRTGLVISDSLWPELLMFHAKR